MDLKEKWIWSKNKITFWFYTLSHWLLLHCYHSAEALFPTLPPAVNWIFPMCFARYTLINVFCCTKKAETGLWGPQLMACLDFKVALGTRGRKNQGKSKCIWEKGKIFHQMGRAITEFPEEHNPLGVLSRVVLGQPIHFSHSNSLISTRSCSLAVPASGVISTNWGTLGRV